MSTINLDAIARKFVAMTDTIIREYSEESALKVLELLREQSDVAIAECNFVIGARSSFDKCVASENVSRETKKIDLTNVVPFKRRTA